MIHVCLVINQVINTRHDAVSGWLLLASFFYERKQYKTTLYIVQHSLLKCSPEKFIQFMNLSDIHYDLLNSHLYEPMTIVQLWKIFRLELVMFSPDSMLIPKELETGKMFLIPPVVYGHFLRFLCHYHLNNSRHYWDALGDLQLTIEENYFIETHSSEAVSYNILGISFQLVGDEESARQAFLRAS